MVGSHLVILEQYIDLQLLNLTLILNEQHVSKNTKKPINLLNNLIFLKFCFIHNLTGISHVEIFAAECDVYELKITRNLISS